MKKMVFVLCIYQFFIFYYSLAGSMVPFCPDGANRRLDRSDTPRNLTGSWVEINRRYTETGDFDWGNSVCDDPGTSCHRGDWFTWWFGIVTPEPPVPPRYTPEYIDFCPGGYDPETGKYLPSK